MGLRECSSVGLCLLGRIEAAGSGSFGTQFLACVQPEFLVVREFSFVALLPGESSLLA
jgi:hypothetical protein